MADNLTQEQRRRSMRAIRSNNTKPEMLLRKALWADGLRGYRLHRRDLPGRPDLVFGPNKLAVFVDGAFWHGHASAFTAGKSGAYWDAKIARNMARDVSANEQLNAQGWTVVRFWDFEIRRSLPGCVAVLRRLLAGESSDHRVPSDPVGRILDPHVRRNSDQELRPRG